jgi:membrane-associated protein
MVARVVVAFWACRRGAAITRPGRRLHHRWTIGSRGEQHVRARSEPAAGCAADGAAVVAGSLVARWQRLSTRRKVSAAVFVALLLVVGAVNYMRNSDGITVVDDPTSDAVAYVSIAVLIFLDAVIPIFPGETTLNAAATAAANGKLDLAPIIVMGAVGAILGDSALFWLARLFSVKLEPQVTRAKANKQVRMAFDLMDRSPAVLIIGGRYVPGMRFVVNATMGLSDIAYRRFLLWSVISGILWSAYTSILAYEIGLALGDFPLASFVISGLVTTVAITVVFFTVRRNRRRLAAAESPEPTEP